MNIMQQMTASMHAQPATRRRRLRLAQLGEKTAQITTLSESVGSLGEMSVRRAVRGGAAPNERR